MGEHDDPRPLPDDHAGSTVLCSATMADLRAEGDDFLLDLIDLFVTEAPTRLALLTSALGAGDRSTAQRTAHTLKSTAAIFGAETMQAIAAAAELAARAGEFREVARLLAPLRTATEEVHRALLVERAMLSSANAAS
jgi:HPt (histidine-containing phosphotransfer) domain-containing protein